MDSEITKNAVLAGLPAQERELLFKSVKVHELRLGEVIDQPGERIKSLYFPIDSAISVVTMQDKQHMVDITVIGKEGCSGCSIVQGSENAPFMTLVEVGGSAMEVTTVDLKERLPQMPYLEAALARYSLLLLRHSGISVGCSQFHSPPERLSRWLMAHWHRTGFESFPFSSDFLAAQAGLDPKTAADVLKEFENEGLIEKSLRYVKILNHEGLKAQACQCFTRCTEATDEYVRDLSDLARSYHGS
jgi:CRP-like cAMP-binding protein